MAQDIDLHPLLRYSHLAQPGQMTCLILWDLREAPSFSVSHTDVPGRRISTFELSQHATSPPIQKLTVRCDVFPFEWPIQVQNDGGITIFDIFQTIFLVARQRLLWQEWFALGSDKQRNRITEVYNARWGSSVYPEWERSGGVIRSDCLLSYTRFGGLTIVPAPDDQWEVILTLARKSLRGTT